MRFLVHMIPNKKQETLSANGQKNISLLKQVFLFTMAVVDPIILLNTMESILWMMVVNGQETGITFLPIVSFTCEKLPRLNSD